MIRRVTARLCAVLLALGGAWTAGFAVFDSVVHRAAPPPPAAGGIVVLTGGAERVDAAFHLLSDGAAPLLLVSGVGRGADLAELDRGMRLSPEQAARVTLGRAATTTRGNARETADWVRAQSVGTLIVVTAGYHMPRALLELGRALPAVALHPVPVQSPALRGGMELATMRLLANEYNKYLAVQLGLTRLAEGS